ncbi:P-loop containing nucleoside triphosphate hydrolase protein [Pleurotus eryngii]|uniref:ATP-dependent RNA helicase n=1 Tax=Pleurotus eryngii TaxID=5323 RepID=A0A9P5ZN20_PLEER|nr:P-loop containing nucleoside triphosphate hydrolase protein [Pleurotus eryngii]
MLVDDVVLEAQALTPPPEEKPTLPVALPSFPLPSLPNAPSKLVLARQGLDPALLDAEIVDPNTSLTIPSDGEVDGGTYLSRKTRKRLEELGIEELFAVQTALLPFLLGDACQRRLYLPHNPPRDICASAPTGSGKTLAYVLPIIEILSTRIVTRLRALIVLPTRDLVSQVRETFEAVGKGSGLKIATATGQHSFAHEQAQLVTDKASKLKGGSSLVDILICTPGRLIDHLNETPNFTLQHLRFLVVDEADRLLAQSFQDWLAQVLAATRPPVHPTSGYELSQQGNLVNLGETSLCSDAVAPAFLHTFSIPDIPCSITERKEPSCQKLLFSATLTRDPGKLAALDLRQPKYFIVQGGKATEGDDDAVLAIGLEKFTMPDKLSEQYVVCSGSQKPLVLFYLIVTYNVRNSLIFTKSAESTTRLVRLFEFFEQARAKEDPNVQPTVARSYSSDLSTSERRSILDKFRSQDIQILVCSDLISRGIDISHVSHVVSYDAPVDMRKYVHRVGRTARAGRSGDAWTLVEEQEVRYFKSMMKDAEHLDSIKRMKVDSKSLELYTKHYELALEQLRSTYER